MNYEYNKSNIFTYCENDIFRPYSEFCDLLVNFYGFHTIEFTEYSNKYKKNKIYPSCPNMSKLLNTILLNLPKNTDEILLNDYLYRLALNYSKINISQYLYNYELITFMDDRYAYTNYNRRISFDEVLYISDISENSLWYMNDLQQLSRTKGYLHMNYKLYDRLFKYIGYEDNDENIKIINQHYVQNNFNDDVYHNYDSYENINANEEINNDIYKSFFITDIIYRSICDYFYINTFGQILLKMSKNKYTILNINSHEKQIPLPNFILNFIILKMNDINDYCIDAIYNRNETKLYKYIKSKINDFINIYTFNFVDNLANMHTTNNFNMNILETITFNIDMDDSNSDDEYFEIKYIELEKNAEFIKNNIINHLHELYIENKNNFNDEMLYIIDIFKNNKNVKDEHINEENIIDNKKKDLINNNTEIENDLIKCSETIQEIAHNIFNSHNNLTDKNIETEQLLNNLQIKNDNLKNKNIEMEQLLNNLQKENDNLLELNNNYKQKLIEYEKNMLIANVIYEKYNQLILLLNDTDNK